MLTTTGSRIGRRLRPVHAHHYRVADRPALAMGAAKFPRFRPPICFSRFNRNRHLTRYADRPKCVTWFCC